jgi:acetyl esterase/lipase
MPRITDWDDAYANAPHIPGGDGFPEAWATSARRYRERLAAAARARLDIVYGPRPRNRLDLFLPAGAPKGLVVFVHGGYWRAFDRSDWSHLAAGAEQSGLAVALPSYTLCPDNRIAGIAREVAAAIATAAGLVDGPLYLAGHSAGGHLVARLVCRGSSLPATVATRLRNVVSISGLHDLRPLLQTGLNATLGIDEAEAQAESPALLRPMADLRLTCWVGAAERPEFIRQSALLANVWRGLGAETRLVEEAGRHHFDVINGLESSGHPLLKTLIAS